MSRLGPEPRINARLLDKYRGQTVRLVVKILSVSGDTAQVQAADGGEIGLHMPREMHIQVGQYVEIIGMVKEDMTIKGLTSIDLGKSLDMKAVQSVIEFAQSHKGEGVLC